MTQSEQEIIAERRAANQANAVTGIYGISGTGKSNLADTAAEYNYETYGGLTMCIAADLGGFGTKRLSLIRNGIMRVYDPRNHVNPFETMELLSLGAFPLRLSDPERGYAEPDVPLILPRRFVFQPYCPSGHATERFESQAVMNAKAAAGMIKCPECGLLVNLANASKVDRLVMRHRIFKGVTLRVFDSGTALNEWALADLQAQSAAGSLPTNSSGGSLLGSADALVSGQFKFGSSSISQYGFVQNRTYGWLSNIRKIPDQVLPAIMTFHVEQSKGDESTGGDMLYGPKIAGNARTGAMAGWLGNLLHATTEPFSETDPTLVYRLWLTNHIDPRDPRKIPYLAKHRGTPIGMPRYLEDKPGDKPWTGFSLGNFFRLQDQQLAAEELANKTKYPNAPGLWQGDELSTAADDIVGSGAIGAPRQASPTSQAVTTSAASATAGAPPEAAGAGRAVRRAGTPTAAVLGTPSPSPGPGSAPTPAAPVAAVAPVAATAAPAAPTPPTPPTAAPGSTPGVTGRSPLRRVARPPV